MSEEDLKRIILEMINEIEECICEDEEEKGDMIVCKFFFERMHSERIMYHIIDKVLPWKKKIMKRDEDFFASNKAIFAGLPDDRISHYGTLINDHERVSQDDRNVIWDYFEVMIKIAEKYKKQM